MKIISLQDMYIISLTVYNISNYTRTQEVFYSYCCKITVSRIVLVLCIGARQLVQHSYIANSSSCYIIYIAEAQNVGSTMTNQR
jgi:hypothetical protein